MPDVAVEAALAYAHQLAMHDINDVGARVESPRGVAEAEELARIEPILAELARTLDVPRVGLHQWFALGNGP
jgi:dihydropteroate synthase